MSNDQLTHLFVNLSLRDASTIVDAALTAGRDAHTHPLTVVVLDVGGHPIALKREDGGGILRVDIAMGKAWGALGMGMSSRTIRDRLRDRPAFQGALAAASEGRFVPVAGGVLITDGQGRALGAVGVSGDASDKDEYCAIEGIKAAGLTPIPEQPSPNWRDAGL